MIIANAIEAPRTPAHTRTALAISASALIVSCVAIGHYYNVDLVLSHYDAKAHLVVARRIIDNITPGWQQIGAVWLPLPHLLNMLPVQMDFFYRTGLSAVLMSAASFILLAYACAVIIFQLTGSPVAAAAGAGIAFINPNLLYLQSTPMTEPLLLGLTLGGIAWLYEAVRSDRRDLAKRAGWFMAGSCLTRYEAWPVVAAALVLSFLARLTRLKPCPTGNGLKPDRSPVRPGFPPSQTLRRVSDSARWTMLVAIYPALAIFSFFVLSRATVGQWFVLGGFFVPDNIAQGLPFKSAQAVWWGVRQLCGLTALLVAVVGALSLAIRIVAGRRSLVDAIPLAVLAAGLLPAYAFYNGHPFRIRYMVPLIPLVGIGVGLALDLLASRPRLRAAAAIGLVALVGLQKPPLSTEAPMVVEAQFDRGNSIGRRQVTHCLEASYHGEKILASMGSLAHYMQETSRAGLHLRDFVHEGNGDIWTEAVASPERHTGWIIIEEVAEGGDVLAERARKHPEFLSGFTRACDGGGIALYRRNPRLP